MNTKPSTPIRDPRRPSAAPALRLINGRLIDTVRRNQELTVEDYALVCRIPFKTMRRICAGRNKPMGDHLLNILRLGGVSVRLLELDGWERRS